MRAHVTQPGEVRRSGSQDNVGDEVREVLRVERNGPHAHDDAGKKEKDLESASRECVSPRMNTHEGIKPIEH